MKKGSEILIGCITVGVFLAFIEHLTERKKKERESMMESMKLVNDFCTEALKINSERLDIEMQKMVTDYNEQSNKEVEKLREELINKVNGLRKEES